MQGHRIFCIGRRGLHKAIGDFLFCLAQNDAGLTLAFGLRLARHGVFQALRNFHVPNFDGLHGNAPGIRLLVEDALQFVAEGFTFGDHLCQFVAADGFTECGLRAEGDRLDKVLNFENGLLGVPDHPEDNGVDVHRDSVTGERGLSRDTCNTNALVHVGT